MSHLEYFSTNHTQEYVEARLEILQLAAQISRDLQSSRLAQYKAGIWKESGSYDVDFIIATAEQLSEFVFKE
jgi:hypothetical protein